MKQTMKAVITAALVAYGISASAQDKIVEEFTKEDLIQDMRLAMDILKKQHPNPYKFIDSISYERQVDSLIKLMAEQKNVIACSRYTPIRLVRDVHTKMSYSDESSRKMYRRINFLPFPVIIERGKILVNIKGEAIPFGAEIISINNQSVKELLATTSASGYSDGFITTGTDRIYPEFQTTFSMTDSDRLTFEVTYRIPGSNTPKKITLPHANPSEAFHSRNKAVMPFNLLQRAYFIYQDFQEATQTGILTVNSFNLQEAYAYKEFSTFFKEVNKRQYKNVIIDIRSNGGGNPAISALLYSFLSNTPFRNEYNYRTKTIDIAYSEYAIADGGRKFSEEDIRNNKNFLYQRFDKDSTTGFYVGNARLKEGQLENFPPDKNNFNGHVYVLTGGGTVSAATYFATLVQKNKRGIIIGKETGSGEQSTTAAWFLTYELPKTKAKLTVPMSELYFFNASTDNGRGVIPDKEVPLDKFVLYVQGGKDPEVTFTLEQIAVDKLSHTR